MRGRVLGKSTKLQIAPLQPFNHWATGTRVKARGWTPADTRIPSFCHSASQINLLFSLGNAFGKGIVETNFMQINPSRVAIQDTISSYSWDQWQVMIIAEQSSSVRLLVDIWSIYKKHNTPGISDKSWGGSSCSQNALVSQRMWMLVSQIVYFMFHDTQMHTK